MRRRSKLIRFFSLFLVVLSCLSCTLFVSADSMEFSSGMSSSNGSIYSFVEPPSPIVFGWKEYVEGFPVALTLDPLIPRQLYSNDYYTQDFSNSFSFDYLDSPFTTTVQYSNFVLNDVSSSQDLPFEGNVSVDFGISTSSIPDTSCYFRYSDFYAWSQLSDEQEYHSEITLSFENLSDAYYEFFTVEISYSELGSTEVYHYSVDGIPFIWGNGEFDIDPALWNGTADYYYIHTVAIFYSDAVPPEFLLGSLDYYYVPGLRSLDLDASSGSAGDEDPSPTASILSFFSDIGNWFVDFTPDIMALFYTPGVDASPGKLTLFGAIALLGLGFVLIFLLFYLVSSFLRFRN